MFMTINVKVNSKILFSSFDIFMALQAEYFKKVFRFNFKAKTSRGPMEDKTSWFIKLWDDINPERFGLGECGPLPGLSLDDTPDFENVLSSVIQRLCELKRHTTFQQFGASTFQRLKETIPPHFPSITFGVETAYLDLLQGGKRIIFRNDFLKGKAIPINGLIWMGDFDFMMEQVDQKIKEGYRCLKLKVGGLDFDRECALLQEIRTRYAVSGITIRLDANGALAPSDAMTKLQALSKYEIHSIEQPIAAGQPEMLELCKTSPIPVAFDEELIRHETFESRKQLLQKMKPAYVVLKPTLHGGLSGCTQWIELAESLEIGWWITSALESNIGLNSICQFTANYPIRIPQGLGTGSIYSNNIESPLKVQDGSISFDEARIWNGEVSLSS
jgi:o-succinylbenzoate synthase